MITLYDAHRLDLGSRSTNIRLLEVQSESSAELQGSLSCKLHVVSLDDDQAYRGRSYTALSYVWGDEASTRSILVNGWLLKVRENLWDFLLQYRNSGGAGYLWVDALCINQLSVSERGHQVALMGRIYTMASKMITWLGLDLERHLTLLRDPWVTRHSRVTSLAAVCAHDYWSRLWIIQEVVLSTVLEIWSGTAKIDGQDLSNLFFASGMKLGHNLVEREDEEFEAALQSSEQSQALKIILSRTVDRAGRYDATLDGSTSIFSHFKEQKCADPRDHIYGLLSLINAKELEAFPIPPDYSKSAAALFVDLVDRRARQVAMEPWTRRAWDDVSVHSIFLQGQLGVEDDDQAVALAQKRILKWSKEASHAKKGTPSKELKRQTKRNRYRNLSGGRF